MQLVFILELQLKKKKKNLSYKSIISTGTTMPIDRFIRTPDTYMINTGFSFNVKMKESHCFSTYRSRGFFFGHNSEAQKDAYQIIYIYEVYSEQLLHRSVCVLPVVGIRPLYTENNDFKGHTGAIREIISVIQHQWNFSNLLLSNTWWIVSKSSKSFIGLRKSEHNIIRQVYAASQLLNITPQLKFESKML